jgi:hypothetical protein
MPDENPVPRGERGTGEGSRAFNNGHDLPQETDRANIIRCELSGSDTAEALGHIVTSSSPVLALCRDLAEADGCFLHAPLAAFRGPILCLWVRSIGEAARLEVNPHGTGFIAFRGRRAGDSRGLDGFSDPQLGGSPFEGAAP